MLAATSRTPVLTTNHNPFVPQTQPVWDAYPWAHNSLSAASAATFPARGAVEPIHHGIDVASFPFGDVPGEDLLFLGRFSPEKGADRAIEAALRSGRRLLLAARSTRPIRSTSRVRSARTSTTTGSTTSARPTGR